MQRERQPGINVGGMRENTAMYPQATVARREAVARLDEFVGPKY